MQGLTVVEDDAQESEEEPEPETEKGKPVDPGGFWNFIPVIITSKILS